MAIQATGSVRALALVGPTSAGKTALMEALLEAATGVAVRPGTDEVYSAEHGPDTDDEVNRLRPGGNYGWDPSQGGTDSYAFLPKQYMGTGQTTLQIPSTTIYTAAWDKLATLDQTPGWESSGTPDPKKLKIDYSLYYHSSGDTPENTTDREPQNMVRAVKAVGLALLRLTR